jgi:hypothetical protein
MESPRGLARALHPFNFPPSTTINARRFTIPVLAGDYLIVPAEMAPKMLREFGAAQT